MTGLQRFAAAYSLDGQDEGRSAWEHPALLACTGYDAVRQGLAGASFEGGLYRVHDAESGPLALQELRSAFPEYAGRATPFGYDWMGRHFAVDAGRTSESGEAAVLLLEPGTGDVYVSGRRSLLAVAVRRQRHQGARG